MGKTLIVLDTDRVKDYVFTTGNLREIRGASGLLVQLNERKGENEGKGESETDKEGTEEVLEAVVGAELDVVYLAGGSGMVLVPDEKVEAAVQAVQRLYGEKTANASISAGLLPISEAREPLLDKQFGRLAALASQALRRAKDEAPPKGKLPLAPWFRHCASCGRDPAEEEDSAEEGLFLCRSCATKRRESDRFLFWKDFTREQKGKWDGAKPAQDFGAIGTLSSPPGYIGFIYADGNAMGEVLKELDSRYAYGKFSKGVDLLVKEVTYNTLDSLAGGPREGTAPFEILMVGGDDLMVVTAADLALPVALKIAQDFEQKSQQRTSKHLSLAVGVVLAHDSYPIATMADLSAELLASAKKESTRLQAQGGSMGAIDFMVVSEASSRSLDWVRSEALTDRSFVFPSIYTCRLTQRPYSLERFAQLYDMALSFKEQGFPQSQLQNLYDSLFTSFNTASFSTITALARLRKGHRQVLNRFIEQFALMDPPPWARVETNAVDTNADDKIYSSPLGDLIEMYRFISRPRS